MSYLYGNREVRAIDVKKRKRKAEGKQGMKFKYKPGHSDTYLESLVHI